MKIVVTMSNGELIELKEGQEYTIESICHLINKDAFCEKREDVYTAKGFILLVDKENRSRLININLISNVASC